MTLAGGLLFGWQLGAALTVVAATIGATALFVIARTSFGTSLAAKAGPSLAKLRDGFKENALSYLLFLRLVPAFPFFIVNLAPALLGVPLKTLRAWHVSRHYSGDNRLFGCRIGPWQCRRSPEQGLSGLSGAGRFGGRQSVFLYDRHERAADQGTAGRVRIARVYRFASGCVETLERPSCRKTILTQQAARFRARRSMRDICVIGAGSGGLSVAAAAAAFGQRVILIEKHKMGGDCLNYGCVPSKALLAAGKRAHAMRNGAEVRHQGGRSLHRSRRGGQSRARRHRCHRAQRLRRALQWPRRARHHGGRALHRPRYGRGRRIPHHRAPLRHRHRVLARRAADTGPARCAVLHQRDDLRQCTQTRSPAHHRRRSDRPGNGAGASPTRLSGDCRRRREGARERRS